jgi:muramoyltetrapeptide carboxypeptidase
MSQFHLIAPSGYCINQDAAQRGVQRLLESGHQVENQTIIPRRQQRFAGTEAQRLNDINSLVNLKGENRIVLAVRGGYGASRLLESIDWQGRAPAAGSAADLRPQRFHRHPAWAAGAA